FKKFITADAVDLSSLFCVANVEALGNTNVLHICTNATGKNKSQADICDCINKNNKANAPKIAVRIPDKIAVLAVKNLAIFADNTPPIKNPAEGIILNMPYSFEVKPMKCALINGAMLENK